MGSGRGLCLINPSQILTIRRLLLTKINYPLARNQCINNSPGIFSCIRPAANTCAACICTEINSPKIFLCIDTRDVRIQALYQYRGQGQSANTYFKNNSSKIFSCIRTSANTGPTCIRAKKLIPQEFFPACIGFVPGGTPPREI